MSKELRVAIIGLGGIARDQHLPAWGGVKNAIVVAAAEPVAATLNHVADEFEIPTRVADYRRLLDDPSIDLVDICVPSALHAEVTLAALAAGKHVLCEKPMATRRADAQAMLNAWRVSGKKLMIGQHLRFDPGAIALRAYLAQNPLGHVYYSRAQWLRRRRLPARPGFTSKALSGGGALFDIGVHVLDLAWSLAQTPAPATAFGATFDRLARRGDLGGEWGAWNPRTIDVEDFAVGMIRYADGSVLQLEASWLGFQREAEQWRVQLFGDKLGVSWPDNHIAGESKGRPWTAELASESAMANGEPKKPHHALIEAFAQSVLDDRDPPIPPAESAMVIAMLEAILVSATTGHEAPIEPFEAAEKPRKASAKRL